MCNIRALSGIPALVLKYGWPWAVAQVFSRPADPFEVNSDAGGEVLPHLPPPPLWFRNAGSVRGARTVTTSPFDLCDA